MEKTNVCESQGRSCLLLCDKCDNFLPPELDQDGLLSMGCKNPYVIDIFMNFCRKNKCKYFKPITKNNLLRHMEDELNRTVGYRNRIEKGHDWFRGSIYSFLRTYLGLRDVLAQLPYEYKCCICGETFQSNTYISNKLEEHAMCAVCNWNLISEKHEITPGV